MLSRRRLTLQITPLLDLLLIVMFSQYIENRHRTVAAQEEVAEQRRVLETERVQLDEQLTQRRSELEQEFSERRQKTDSLRQLYDERFKSIIDQHHQIGSLIAETLNLPGAAVAEILKLRTSNSPDDAARLTAATERLQELMTARGEDVFRFYVKVDEMQKHVSIWEIHLQDNAQALISDGQQSFTIDVSTEADFAGRFFESSKAFTEPKTLVIVLLSWGDAQAGSRQHATDAMTAFMEQLRRDAAGTRWYDFSIVGYRAQGPLFSNQVLP